MRNLGGFFHLQLMKTTKINYSKSPLSFKEQLHKLKKRGLLITNEQHALDVLSRINYYRLSAYWLPFKQKNASGSMTDSFQEGTEFNSIVKLYEFDRKLRLLVMDALEREISIRTSITYFLAHKYGALALHNAENFHPQFNHSNYIQKFIKKLAVPENHLSSILRKNTMVFLNYQCGWPQK